LRGIETIDCPPVAAWSEVAIDVNRHLNTRMTQLLFHVNRAFVLAQQQAGEGMPDTDEIIVL